MSVGVAGTCGFESRVHPDEDADKVRSEDVDKIIGKVGVFAWWSVG